jgi:hypothetical protein
MMNPRPMLGALNFFSLHRTPTMTTPNPLHKLVVALGLFFEGFSTGTLWARLK